MIYALLGFLAGIVSGMGLGGGTLLIPMLTLFGSMGQRAAQGTNLVAFLPAAAAALFSHIRANRVNRKLALKMALWGVLGMIAGTGVALLVSEELLKKAFAVFLMVLAIVQLISGEQKARKERGAKP